MQKLLFLLITTAVVCCTNSTGETEKGKMNQKENVAYPEVGSCYECKFNDTFYYLITLELNKEEEFVNFAVISDYFNHNIDEETIKESNIITAGGPASKSNLFGLIVDESEFLKFTGICSKKFQLNLKPNSFQINSGFSLFGGNGDVLIRNLWNVKVTSAMNISKVGLREIIN